MLRYDIFHFYGQIKVCDTYRFLAGLDVTLLKLLGKKVVYTQNGCRDGILQSTLRHIQPGPVCDICVWRDAPAVCSDERNAAQATRRNALADLQVISDGCGNRADFNADPRVQIIPEFYGLDPEFWDPGLEIPAEYRLAHPAGTVRIYHAVGKFDMRTDASTRKNLKTTHIYLPVIEQLKTEGYPVELVFFHDVPNRVLRYYQAQADIFVDMLTYGWYGTTIREALMLGKTAVCYIRPEWLDVVRREYPEYAHEIPIVSATPENVHDILVDLVVNPEKRQAIGLRSREFALKWHSAGAGGRRFDRLYSGLLADRHGGTHG